MQRFQDCAYFFFNTIGDSKDIFLMKIWLEGDKVRQIEYIDDIHTKGNWEAWSKKMKLIFESESALIESFWRLGCPNLWCRVTLLEDEAAWSSLVRVRPNSSRKPFPNLFSRRKPFPPGRSDGAAGCSQHGWAGGMWQQPVGADPRVQNTLLYICLLNICYPYFRYSTQLQSFELWYLVLLVSRPTLKLSGGNCQVSSRTGKTGWVDHLFAMWSGMKNLFSFYKKVETKHVPKSCPS